MEEGESLSDKRHINLILRVVLDKSGQLQQGEVVAMTGSPSGRFNAWGDMASMAQKIIQQVWGQPP
jgi:hypothetical protein